jgi:hypothetical protein
VTTTEISLIDVMWASRAVTCPRCNAKPGRSCTSTGGGNHAEVATHALRDRRVQHWADEFAAEAGRLARSVSRKSQYDWSADIFDRFESAAAPLPAKSTKPLTPKGVRLSEQQAEEIERYVLRGGYGWIPTAHFSGDAQHRQTANALEAKGIVEFVEMIESGYSRRMRLTAFGWDVYRQHRLIIRNLTDAEVAEQVARAEEGRCLTCGSQPGAGSDCHACKLERFSRNSDVIVAFNQRHEVGTQVRYWRGTRDDEPCVSTTRTGARLLSGHTPIVWVEGDSSCIALTHVEVIA